MYLRPPPPPGGLGCCPFPDGGSVCVVPGSVVVDLLFMYFQWFVWVLCLSWFWYALLCVLFSFAIILKRKRELGALLLFSYGCLVYVLWLFLTVPWVGLQCVIVVFPDYNRLLFLLNSFKAFKNTHSYRGARGKMIHFFEIFYPAFMTGYILLLLDV